MRKATQSSRAAPPIPGEGCLPGICPEGRGAASCHPQSWDGSGDPSSHLCFDLRQPVDTSGPRGRGHWADGGQAPDLPKSYRDTEPRGCFLTPFCSTRPMPRFPAWEFPKSPPPSTPPSCGVITGYRGPSSKLSSWHQRGRAPSSGQTAAQILGLLSPCLYPSTLPTPPSDAPWSARPCLASLGCESPRGKARTQPLAHLGAPGEGMPLPPGSGATSCSAPAHRACVEGAGCCRPGLP